MDIHVGAVTVHNTTLPPLPTAAIHSNNDFFIFTATSTTNTYTLPLPDALPISQRHGGLPARRASAIRPPGPRRGPPRPRDRESTRLNSSHSSSSYAVFCLNKKNKKREQQQ